MSKNAQIKAAACRLGLAMEQRVEAMRLAVGENETIRTSTDLSILFLDNADFIVWALKKAGGLNVGNPEPLSPARPNGLVKLPASLTGINDDENVTEH